MSNRPRPRRCPLARTHRRRPDPARRQARSPKPGMRLVPIRWARSRIVGGRNGMAASATTSAGSGVAMPGMLGAFASRICRQLRSLRAGSGKGSGVQHQLCHMPRWLHPERPTSATRKTQRRQWRRQSRWRHLRISVPTMGWRAKSDVPAVTAVRPAADQELPAYDSRSPGRADASRRRRISPHTARATIMPTAKTTRRAGSTGRSCHRHDEILSICAAMCSRFVGNTLRCVGRPSTPMRTFSGSIREWGQSKMVGMLIKNALHA